MANLPDINKKPEPSYWAVIPANVRYDNELRASAKLLYAEISALANRFGRCFAGNEYFCELFGISARTLYELINQLNSKGYIGVETINTGGVKVRYISVAQTATVTDRGAKNRTSARCGKSHVGTEATCEKLQNRGAKNRTDNKENNNINNNTPLKPPQGGEGANVETSTRSKSAPKHRPERFERLWQWYPHAKRGNRQRAIKAWDKLKPSDELIDTIAAAMRVQFRSPDWARGIGVPHVASYLNAAYWEDASDAAEAELEAEDDSATGWAADPEVLDEL